MTHEEMLYNTEELVCQVMPGYSPGQSLEKSLMDPRVGTWQWEGPQGWGPVDVTQTQKHPTRFLLLTQLGLSPKVISFPRLEDVC